MQGPGNAVGGDFSGLRNYITSRLLWNPDLSGEVLEGITGLQFQADFGEHLEGNGGDTQIANPHCLQHDAYRLGRLL